MDQIGMGELVAGRYQVEGLLGHGGMAVVYRARHTGTGRACALKVILPHLAQRPGVLQLFVKEAQVGGRIGSSPFIVDVFDTGVDPARSLPFLAMELLEGETLAKLVERGPVGPEILRPLLKQLGVALGKAHEANVVHRDLKPSNLFIVKDWEGRPQLKVLDFGIAKVLEGDLSRTATEIGTPAYAAPEQLGPAFRQIALNQGVSVAEQVSAATDIWALGLVAYESLTGLGPGQYWGATTASDLPLMMAMALRDSSPATARAGDRAYLLPAGFDDWFARCTRIDARERWTTAAQAVGELDGLLASTPAVKPMVQTSLAGLVGTLTPATPRGVPDSAAAHAVAPAVSPVAAPSTTMAAGAATFVPASGAKAARAGGKLRLKPLHIAAGVLAVAVAAGGLLGVRKLAAGGDAATPASGAALMAPEQEPATWSDADAFLPVDQSDPVLGSRRAAVTWVIIGDYQCPFTKKLVEMAIKLQASYGNADLRLVWKDNPLPFHKEARSAALAARAVFVAKGNDAYWKYSERLFANPKNLSDENLKSWAKELGVAPDAYDKAIADPAQITKVDFVTEQADGGPINAQGTPTSYFNGIRLVGALPEPTLRRTIDLAATIAGPVGDAGGTDRLYVEVANSIRKSPETVLGPLCERGTFSACVALGDQLRDASEHLRAIEWYGRACDRGYGNGCTTLGSMYSFGQGVTKDEAKGFDFSRRACEAGDFDTCTTVGDAHLRGTGTPKDATKAAIAFQRGCDNGSPACTWLAGLYERGEGVPKDDSKAASLYEKACNGATRENRMGCSKLARMAIDGRGMPKDEARAKDLLIKACPEGSGYSEACGLLGWWYVTGNVVEKDKPKGLSLLRYACNKGATFGYSWACSKLKELNEPQ